MSNTNAQNEYTPPEVWEPTESGGKFASINAPTAGARFDKELPSGEHPLQLHSLATPNGVKVTVMLEELLEAGHDAEYDAYPVDISEGEQFGSGFVALNPNSKIPALLDRSTEPHTRVFESGAILLYLAEKFGAFLPSAHTARTETLCWLFWQMGAAPLSRWWIRALLRLRTHEDALPHRPLHDGNQATARLARQATVRERLHRR